MPLPDEIRVLADRVVDRLDEAREFCVHCRQAWRLVQQLARKGRPVGIVDLATKRRLPPDLESRAQKYVTVQLAESSFRELSSLLEDWVLGLIQLSHGIPGRHGSELRPGHGPTPRQETR
jgi:hypothetical protein